MPGISSIEKFPQGVEVANPVSPEFMAVKIGLEVANVVGEDVPMYSVELATRKKYDGSPPVLFEVSASCGMVLVPKVARAGNCCVFTSVALVIGRQTDPLPACGARRKPSRGNAGSLLRAEL